MTVSALIKRLEGIKESCGDLPVVLLYHNLLKFEGRDIADIAILQKSEDSKKFAIVLSTVPFEVSEETTGGENK